MASLISSDRPSSLGQVPEDVCRVLRAPLSRRTVVQAEERLHVIAEPAFVADLQNVGTAHVGQYIAPMVVVLNEIALRKTHTKSLSSLCVASLHSNRRN